MCWGFLNKSNEDTRIPLIIFLTMQRPILFSLLLLSNSWIGIEMWSKYFREKFQTRGERWKICTQFFQVEARTSIPKTFRGQCRSHFNIALSSGSGTTNISDKRNPKININLHVPLCTKKHIILAAGKNGNVSFVLFLFEIFRESTEQRQIFQFFVGMRTLEITIWERRVCHWVGKWNIAVFDKVPDK